MIGFNTNTYNGAYPPTTPAVAAAIDAKKVSVVYENGLWYCFVVDPDNKLACYRSSSNFNEPTWTEDANKFFVTSIVDNSQLSAYAALGVLYVAALRDSDDVLFKSADRGRTWTQQTN